MRMQRRTTFQLRAPWAFAVAVAAALVGVRPAFAQVTNLADLSLEQLVDIEITSVSKRETSLFRSPAAIAVVTSDDIRRLGITSYPEALRGVPGLNVGRIDHNIWAIGARGFAYQYTDKLLVLQDGRTLYTPSFAGVFWDAHDSVLEDVDRIEVIRGPGATLWGSNAVNGVINIITKSAAETQGGLFSIAGGPGEGREASVRYGGRAGAHVFYRVSAKQFDRDPMVGAAGEDLPENWKSLRGGLRVDWLPTADDLVTFQVDSMRSEVREILREYVFEAPFATFTPIVSDSRTTNVLGRWTRTFSDAGELSVQSYFDTGWHDNLGTKEFRDTFDLEVQHRFAWRDRHDIMWGAGYRTSSDDMRPAPDLVWLPQRETIQLGTAFVQDEVALVPEKLHFTIGSKFEHHDATGLELQPGARALWMPAKNHTVWAAVARAVRTPSRINLGASSDLGMIEIVPGLPPVQVVMRGDPDLKSEVMWAHELGYRGELGSRLSVDLAVFHNEYSRLITFVPAALEFSPDPLPHMVAPLATANASGGRGVGGELEVQWLAMNSWRLGGNFALQDVQTSGVEFTPFNITSRQAGLRSFLDLPFHIEQTTALTWVDALPSPFPGVPEVPAHTRLDVGFTWRPSESLEVGIWGRNLLEAHHLEFTGISTAQPAEVPRSFLGRVTWRF
jgi:iron complex outermembrane recepter protein